ncbi:unnamed protein product [Adineta ricciae]|uniref:Mediator of RNA polymerase II transcription subunit 16 central helical bridge domain-containing protein n=1 Tax=Adineta ricciae TaxID=249248 RepID=A0A814MUN3_ADIRI|nr:unnamed protein product [Adineta ricciae]
MYLVKIFFRFRVPIYPCHAIHNVLHIGTILIVTSALHQLAKSSFCVYICALEQPWHVNLITTSIVPIVQLVWSLDGTHILVCNQTGLCQIFKMKDGCINRMDYVYHYETNEDILSAKYIFPHESITIDVDRDDSSFYSNVTMNSSSLDYALNSGNFVCVTTSGTIHILPLRQSLRSSRCSLSQNEPLSASICHVYSTDKGFNVILSEHVSGALVHFFAVQYTSLEPHVSCTVYRLRGFRIASCYGTLESLVYFQRYGNNCILTHMKSSSGDLLDVYEYDFQQEEWLSTTLLSLLRTSITSMCLPTNQLISENYECQGLFGRQILFALDDCSIVRIDKLNFKCKERFLSMADKTLDINQSSFFVQIQHTYSGSCCVGFTKNGFLIFLRTINLSHMSSSSSLLNLLVHLCEQYIIQTPCPCDIWDILCLIPKNSIIDHLIDRLVSNYESQSLEFKRTYFVRFKECLYHLHRLAFPLSSDSCEHLTSLIVYHILSIVRNYLRLFIYETTNRTLVDVTQEILQQPLLTQNIDIQRIKYLGDHENVDQYQLVPFTLLVNWIVDIIVYFIGFLQTSRTPSCRSCKNLFRDSSQIQWLRELTVYFYILHKTNRIPNSKVAQVHFLTQRSPTNSNTSKDIWKDIYHSLTKYQQILQGLLVTGSNESCLNDFSILDLEMIQSKINNMFPRLYPCLIPNSSTPQLFSRIQPPTFMTYLSESSSVLTPASDIQFDIITLGKMSLTSNQTFRRCIRCSNFSRLFTTTPLPPLASRLNNHCVCGGLFVLHAQSAAPSAQKSNANNDK